MKTAILTLALLLCGFSVTEAKDIRVRDASGRITSTVKTNGTRIIVRDSSGRLTGTITVKQKTVVQRDRSGRIR